MIDLKRWFLGSARHKRIKFKTALALARLRDIGTTGVPVRLRAGLLLLVITTHLIPPAWVVETAPPVWESVGPGIEYGEFHLSGPNNAFVARMDRDDPNVTIDSSIAQGRLSGGVETVSDMAARYDQALNFWGQDGGKAPDPPVWGTRNRVVVAINGSFYNISSGVPQNGQIHSGWYAKRFDDLGGGTGFAWRWDRYAFIGGCAYHRPERQLVVYPASGEQQWIDRVNVSRETGMLVLYTPQYAGSTLTDDDGVEVLVEMTRPAAILPSPAYASGYVRDIRTGQGSTSIPFDHVVLSASGAAAGTLAGHVSVGDEVRISQEITHFEADCETPLPTGWTKTYASVGGSFYFLEDGQINTFDDPGATTRQPRSAVAFNNSYVYFIVVDGRDMHASVGMTITELAAFARDTLGAAWGIALDGGGSATLVVNGEVKNNTFCNNVYCLQRVFLPIVGGEGSAETPQEGDPQPPDAQPVAAPLRERLVANGLMMVVVEPAAWSTFFAPGEMVTTTKDATVYLGPGTNYTALTTVPKSTPGVVLDHLMGLNGIMAKDTFWWKVSFGEVTGWVSGDVLVSQRLSFWMQEYGRSFSSGLWQLYTIVKLWMIRWFR